MRSLGYHISLKAPLIIGLGIVAVEPARAAKPVSGAILQNTTWTKKGGPYDLTGTVTIAPGVTLTIQSDVAVRFNNGSNLLVKGRLLASGSDANHTVLFEKKSGAPSPGSWGSVIFQSATPSPSVLDYVKFTDGGAESPGMVVIDNSIVTLTHVQVAASATAGVYVTGPQASLTLNNSGLTGPKGKLGSFGITGNLSYGLQLMDQAAATVNEIAFTGNGSFAIAQQSGTTISGLTGIASSGNGSNGGQNGIKFLAAPPGSNTVVNDHWPAMTGCITLTDNQYYGAGSTLTIDPRTCIYLYPGISITMNGTLTALGTDDQAGRITFSPAPNLPAPGNWGAIVFGTGSGSTSRMSHVLLDRGGIYQTYYSTYDGVLYAANAVLQVDHVLVSHPLKKGIVGNGAGAAVNLALDTVTVDGAGDTGIVVSGSQSTATLSGCSVTSGAGLGLDVSQRGSVSLNGFTASGNAGYAIGAEPNTTISQLDSITATGNGGDAIYYRGGYISTDEVWLKGLPWFVSASTTVDLKPGNVRAASLTISSGVIVKMAASAKDAPNKTSLMVNGRLKVAGTAQSPVTITSSAEFPKKGDWGSIYIYNYTGLRDDNSSFSYANISYGGTYYDAVSGTTYDATLFVRSGSPQLDHVVIDSAGSKGIKLDGTKGYEVGYPIDMTLSNSTISNSVQSGLEMWRGNTQATVDNSSFTANGALGVDLHDRARAALNTVSFINNTGYAIGAEPNTTISQLDSITATGNGGDAIYYRGGYISTDEVWRKGLPWFVSAITTVNLKPGNEGAASLTINGGVIVKMAASAKDAPNKTSLVVYGRLTVVGTAQAPVTITSSAAPPLKGDWGSIYIYNYTGLQTDDSSFSYTNISYGGTYNNGTTYDATLFVQSGSPLLDHVVIDSAGSKGIKLDGNRGNEVGHPILMTLSNSTISNSVQSGLEIWRGNTNAVISATNFTGNGSYGVDLHDRSSASFSQVNFMYNANYAIGDESNAPITRLDSVTASGNGGSPSRDAIGYRGGSIDTDETWLSGLPWVVLTNTVVSVKPNSGGLASLSILAGANVRFAAGINMEVYGTLAAAGIAPEFSVPVTISFDGNSATDRWGYIRFNPGSSPESRIQNASITFSGASANGAIYVNGSSPSFRDVTISNSTGAAIYVSGQGANPVIFNCSFIGNAYGVYNATPNSVTVDARFNYWDCIDGPGAICHIPGDPPSVTHPGQTASTGVLSEPWLAKAAPVGMIQRITRVSQLNRTLNPNLGIGTRLQAETTSSSNWRVQVLDSAGTSLKGFSGFGSAINILWDGTDNGGLAQANGTYTYEVTSDVGVPNDDRYTAIPVRGRMIIDRSKQFCFNTDNSCLPSVTPALSPGNGYFNSTRVNAALTASSTCDLDPWTARIYSGSYPGGKLVRTLTASGQLNAVWDGKSDAGTQVDDGLYVMVVDYTVGSLSGTLPPVTVVLDTLPPTASFDSPKSGAILSNVRGTASQSGINAWVDLIGSAYDDNLLSWKLESCWGGGYCGQYNWATLLQNQLSNIRNAELYRWDTGNLIRPEGTFYLRLTVTDRAGNVSSQTLPVSVENFQVRMANESDPKFNPASHEQELYISSIPSFPILETLRVMRRNSSRGYEPVRTLISGLIRRAADCNYNGIAGNCADPWDGKDDAGNALPDGPYFFVASAVDAANPANSLQWDLTTTYHVDRARDGTPYQPMWIIPCGHFTGCTSTNANNYDPYNNKPLVSYFRQGQSRPVTYFFSTVIPPEYLTTPISCDQPNYCLRRNVYVPSGGTPSFTWAGVDAGGKLWPDAIHYRVVSEFDTWPYNSVVLYGNGAPVTVSQVRVEPNVVGDEAQGPGEGAQRVTFNLASFNNRAVMVKLKYIERATGHVSRTIDLGSITPSGSPQTATWDGRSDSGRPAMPGRYSVIVEATAPDGFTSSDMIGLLVNY